MNVWDTLKSDTPLAPAYVIETDNKEAPTLLTDALSKRGIATTGNPDFLVVPVERLSVDEVRTLINFASLAPLGEGKYLIVIFSEASEEAQSALLKAVEEGKGHTTFFFLVPQGAMVLPTLRSRSACFKDEAADRSTAGGEFLALSIKDRIALVEKLAKNHDREGARAIVRDLLTLHEEKPFTADTLRDLIDAHRFLGLSGSSIKAALGHIALTISHE